MDRFRLALAEEQAEPFGLIAATRTTNGCNSDSLAPKDGCLPISASALRAAGWEVTNEDGVCMASTGGLNGTLVLVNVTKQLVLFDTQMGFLVPVDPPQSTDELLAWADKFLRAA